MTKSTTQPTARIVELTPELASSLLDRNLRNRKVSGKNYALVLRAIRNGEWRLNGEAIKLDTNGFMLDGQHRCRAVVESGVSILTLLIEDLEPDTQDTMDTGKSRSLADILQIRGEASATSLAAVIRRVYLWKSYGLRSATVSSYPTTNHECLQFFAQNQWIRDLVTPAKRIARMSKLPGSLAGLLMTVFNDIDSDDSDYFFDRLCDGENLPAGSPILLLRKSLINLHESKGTSNQTYMAALVVKAWNKYRAGESLGTLKFTPGGANPESFPEPK